MGAGYYYDYMMSKMSVINVRRGLFAALVVIATLLVIFNMRTRIPFSIGVRVYQIPFFVAFAIAYGLGVVSYIALNARMSSARKLGKGKEETIKSQ